MKPSNINCIYCTKNGECISLRKYRSYNWIRRIVSNLFFRDKCTLIDAIHEKCNFQEKYSKSWPQPRPVPTPAPPLKTNNTAHIHLHLDKD